MIGGCDLSDEALDIHLQRRRGKISLSVHVNIIRIAFIHDESKGRESLGNVSHYGLFTAADPR